jgi:hypothetical protein
LFDREADDFETVVDDLVRERAARLDDRRQRNLAIRIGNAMSGARSVDGGGSSNTSSTR